MEARAGKVTAERESRPTGAAWNQLPATHRRSRGRKGSRWCISASVGVILAIETVSMAWKWNNISCVPIAIMLFIMRGMR